MKKEKLDLSIFNEEERKKIESIGKGNIKKAVVVGLSAILVATTMLGLAHCFQGGREPIETQSSSQEAEYEWSTDDWEKEGDYYVVGRPELSGGYYTYSQEDVMKMAQNSIDRINQLLGEVDGVTRYGSDNNVLPDFLDAQFLTAMVYQESTFRSTDKNGTPIPSYSETSTACGLTQIEDGTIDYLNDYWLPNIMGINDLKFAYQDRANAQKSMDMAVLILMATHNNFASSQSEKIFSHIKGGFNEENQKKAILVYYNCGEENVNNYIKNGTIQEYFTNSTAHANKVLNLEKDLNLGIDLPTGSFVGQELE